MTQLTLRIPESLAQELKAAARSREMSVNGFAAAVLEAAIDPDLAENSMERLRGRLARAGLLENPVFEVSGRRPPADRVIVARKKAGQGKSSLSEIVSEGRN